MKIKQSLNKGRVKADKLIEQIKSHIQKPTTNKK